MDIKNSKYLGQIPVDADHKYEILTNFKISIWRIWYFKYQWSVGKLCIPSGIDVKKNVMLPFKIATDFQAKNFKSEKNFRKFFSANSMDFLFLEHSIHNDKCLGAHCVLVKAEKSFSSLSRQNSKQMKLTLNLNIQSVCWVLDNCWLQSYDFFNLQVISARTLCLNFTKKYFDAVPDIV